jgi:hypothetical protein
LVAAETLIGTCELSEFARIPVDTRKPRFTGPLKQSIQTMSGFGASEIVLLGSVATGKCTDTLLPLLDSHGLTAREATIVADEILLLLQENFDAGIEELKKASPLSQHILYSYFEG